MIGRIARATGCFLALGAAGTPLSAQVPDTTRADTLPAYQIADLEVSVTRTDAPLTRLPFAIDRLDHPTIQTAQRTVSLDEALRFVPGLFVQNRRNFSLGDRIAARGTGARAQFGVRGLRVISDGISLTLADGQSTLTNLDLASAGRIEVIRGPAAAMYGNAAGGVISIRTESAPTRPLVLEPMAVGGSYGFFQTRLKAAGSAGGFGYVTNFTYLDTDGFREYGAARVFRANMLGTTPVGGGELRALFNLYHTPFAENSSSLDRETARNDPTSVRSFIISQGAGEEATQGQGGLALDLPLSESIELRAAGWGLWRDLWNPIPGRIIQIDRFAGGLRGELRGVADPGELGVTWGAGIDVELQSDDRTEFDNLGVEPPDDVAVEGELLLDQAEHVLGVGPYARLNLHVGTGWTFTAAGRFDSYRFDVDDRFVENGDDSGDRTMSEFSPAFGVIFSPNRDLSVFGNYTTAFQTPTTSELSNRPGGGGGFNPDLDPERVRSFEVGLRAVIPSARIGLSASGFVARVRDALVPRQGPTEESFFTNAGKIDRSGAEIGVVWEPLATLVAELNYTAQRLRFDEFVTEAGDFSGNKEPGVPEQWLLVSLQHAAAFGLSSELNFRWVDAYVLDDANTASNWSYALTDLRFSFDRTSRGFPVRLFLGVDNLFDERYNGSVVPNAFGARFYEPAPGAEIYGGVSWPLRIGAGAP